MGANPHIKTLTNYTQVTHKLLTFTHNSHTHYTQIAHTIDAKEKARTQ